MADEPEPTKTFHVKGVRENEAAILFYAIPFFPEITLKEDSVEVEFNEGYIYDHANMKTDDFDGKTSDNASIPRIKVTDRKHTHNTSGKVKYSLEIKRSQKSGEVFEAKIVNSDNKGQKPKTFRNFIVENEIELGSDVLPAEAGNGNDSYVYMDLAEFDGFELQELYLRENIHVYYRGFEQLGSKVPDPSNDKLTTSAEVFSIVNATGVNSEIDQNVSTGANSMIGIKAIAKRADKGDGVEIEDQNIIEIEEDENYIYLFVPRTDVEDFASVDHDHPE